ncbi:hypothetical protein K32_01690 [Kaistia sp. 32K]|uniref:class I SAM-dependent methyltransferase n=1 Tax=Kaistia sp. 32K TaxID=2795690 RepID=UPI0019167999|nr:class I SAM-dependent methyltransferase [Kaistia sp. 32K]BCP51552.1 hypothetical protein K32_01690 [Kaistia sp. 32K]
MNGIFSPVLADIRKRNVGPQLRGRVLDFGCGVGRLCDLVAADRFVGVDTGEDVLAAARQRNPGYTFQPVSMLGQLGSFDTIVAMAVIGYFDDLSRLLGSFAEKLTPTGRIVITSPTRLAAHLHRIGRTVRLFGDDFYEADKTLPQRPEFEAASARAKLRIVEYQPFMLGLNQLVVISR